MHYGSPWRSLRLPLVYKTRTSCASCCTTLHTSLPAAMDQANSPLPLRHSNSMMSLMNYFLNGMMDEFPRSSHELGFGSGLPPRFSRPLSRQNKALVRIINDKEALKINLDVQQFSPDELSVKVAQDFVVVEGKHEEKNDEHGTVSRHFVRRYQLPGNVDRSAIISNLSSDGVLQIIAPKEPPSEDDEREIPITQTNRLAITLGEEEQTEEEKPENPDE